jgi:hypothetical protein
LMHTPTAAHADGCTAVFVHFNVHSSQNAFPR